MILGTAVQQSECNLLLNWIFEKNPANIYRITQMCPKSNVVFYRSGHHWTAFNNDFFQLYGKKK